MNKSGINIKHPGAFHRYLGLKEGDPIPQSAIDAALKSKDPHVREMANFARNSRHFDHAGLSPQRAREKKARRGK